jgi:hypothetical protein
MSRERTGARARAIDRPVGEAYGWAVTEQPQIDITEARAAISEAEALLEAGTPARADILTALHELRADIANGEDCADGLRALRAVLDRAS